MRSNSLQADTDRRKGEQLRHLVGHKVDGGVQAVLLVLRAHHAVAQRVHRDLRPLPPVREVQCAHEDSAMCQGLSTISDDQ